MDSQKFLKVYSCIATFVIVILLFVMFFGKKDGFIGDGGLPGSNNMKTSNRMPLWWYGSIDAGRGGSMDSQPSQQALSIYNPNAFKRYQWLRPGFQYRGRRRGMGNGYGAYGGSGAGSITMPGAGAPIPDSSMPDTSWMEMQYQDGGIDSDCAMGWSDEATTLVQALNQAGSYTHTQAGEGKLLDAIDAGDSGGSLDEATLENLNFHNGAP